MVKPDQLFGKRGKHGLVLLNADWQDAKAWIEERMNTEVNVGETTGTLSHFLIEPFVPHPEEDEHYLAISARRDDDVIYFSPKGGIFVEENWDQVIQIRYPLWKALMISTCWSRLPLWVTRRKTSPTSSPLYINSMQRRIFLSGNQPLCLR